MNQHKEKTTVLVIDDDPVIRDFLRSILKEKHNIFAVEAPSTAFKILKNEKVHLIICDFKLPEMDGLQVLERVKAEYPGISVIMISSAGNMDVVIDALRKGAVDFLKKPFDTGEIWIAIERTLKYSDLNANLDLVKKKNSVLKQVIKAEAENLIIGKSSSINNIRHQIKMVAATPDTSVLIIGESGTGKELVARGIHEMSSRKDELFCAVNMSAIPESLFESEFFGHKKGSFTGAISDKAGWFETANGGTLFLDEIGEMTIPLQVKLLRVLEDRRYTKVGAHQENKFDIRLMAATNKPIPELTSGTKFRLDLYHRIGTFIIEMPKLKDRKSDIPELADHFLKDLVKKLGKPVQGFSNETYELLKSYSYPGNVRELRNIIERAVILSNNEFIRPSDIQYINPPSVFSEQQNPLSGIYDLTEIEKQIIMNVLNKVNYNKAEAARLLNIEWNSLYRRIQKHKIKIPTHPENNTH